MTRRVVVTGLGVVSPLGVGKDAFWKALLAGHSGVGPITGFDAAAFSVPIGGEIPPERFNAARFVPNRKQLKLMGRIIQLAMGAAWLAVEDAQLSLHDIPAERKGIYLGANMDDMGFLDLCGLFALCPRDDDPSQLDLRKFGHVAVQQSQPLTYLQAIPNMAASHLAIAYEARGPSSTLYATGVGGLQAIGEAALAIAAGRADAILAGGTDSGVTPDTLRRASILGPLMRQAAPPASSPFAPQGDGIVVGEGAGVLVLEPLEAALKRRATIYGEILGYASAVDGDDFPAPAQTSQALVQAMRTALQRAGLHLSEVDYVSCHGETTPTCRLEMEALAQLFGPYRAQLPVGVLKPLMGHLGAASGAVETIATLLAMTHGMLPPSTADVGANHLGEATHAPPHARPYVMTTALCNALLRGQLCVSLVLRRFQSHGGHNSCNGTL